MRYSKLALVGLALALAGCASGIKYKDMSASIAAVPPDQGRIYFFRSGSAFGAAIQPDIMLDQVNVGTSKPGGFFYIDTNAGGHKASTTTEVENNLTFMLDRGETKYVRTSISFGLFVGHVAPELISPDQAIRELQELSYIGTAPVNPAHTNAGTTSNVAISKVDIPAAPELRPIEAAIVANQPDTLAATTQQPNVYSPSTPRQVLSSQNDAVPIEVKKVEFKLGLSSNTVEKLARQDYCDSDLGAGLLANDGPIEVYRVNCKDGRVFMARCEMRQCVRMQGPAR